MSVITNNESWLKNWVQRYLRANINIGRGCAITARESIIKSGARKTTKGSFSIRLFSLRQITSERDLRANVFASLAAQAHSLLNSDVVLPFHTLLYITRSILCRYTQLTGGTQHSHKCNTPFETPFFFRHIPLHPTTAETCKKSKSPRNLIHSCRVRKRKQNECTWRWLAYC